MSTKSKTLAVAAVGAIAAAGSPLLTVTPAAAAVTCGYDLVERTVTVDMSDDATDDVARIATSDDGHITVNDDQCGALATVLLTDTIAVAGTSDFEQVVLESDLGPGLTPELDGKPEIEVEIAIEGDPHLQPPAQAVVLRGTDGDDHITVGSDGANVNSDNDIDVTATGTFEWVTYSLAGDDVVTGAGDEVTGDPTSDHRMVVVGGAGSDVLTGGEHGYDAFLGGPGDDTMDGSAGGRDSANYQYAEGSVSIDLAADQATGADGNDALLGIESAAGSEFADTLLGSDEPNVLRGQGGVDTLQGGVGDDILWGDEEADDIDGGDGNDQVSYEETAKGAVEIDIRHQTAVFPEYPEEDETFTSIEGARGGSYDDTITGDDEANVLYGSPGVDAIIGLDGADTLWAVPAATRWRVGPATTG